MENTLYIAAHMVYTLFESYILYKLMHIFLGKPVCKKKYVILAYGFRFAACNVQYYYLPYAWLNTAVGIVTLFIITLCHGKNIQKKLMAVLLTIMCLLTAEVVVAVFYELCNIGMSAEGHNGNEFAYIGIAIVLSMIYKFIAGFKNIDNEISIPKRVHMIIIAAAMMLFFLVTMLFYEDVSRSLTVMSAICMLLILFLLMHIYDLMAKHYTEKMQAEIAEKEKQYYHKQIELMQENGKKLSNFRHDIKNHLSVIQGLLDNDSQSAKEYIEKLVNKVENTRTFSNTGNIAVDSVVNYKLSKAEEEGISVNAEIILPPRMGNDMDDMVTVLGNILDNAIEANRVPGLEKYINASVRYKSGMVFIKVANSYDGRMNMKNGQIATKKNDKGLHGIGLKSVQSVVDKYNGTMDIDYDDKQFGLKIVLYI